MMSSTKSLLVMAIALPSLVVLPGLASAASSTPARVIGGCTIVPNPTPTHHTVCPGANLIGGSLVDWNLSFAVLTRANLSGDDAQGAKFTHSDLQMATITHTSLADANLFGTDLKGANLSDSSLSGAVVKYAHLSGITWSNTTCPDGTNSNNDGDTCVNNLG
jgi:hypothetical protein